jgi:hypothetical protein
MFGQGRSKRATADYDDVEWPEVTARRQAVGAAGARVDRNEHLVERVASVAPQYIARKVSVRCRQTEFHILSWRDAMPELNVTASTEADTS